MGAINRLTEKYSVTS